MPHVRDYHGPGEKPRAADADAGAVERAPARETVFDQLFSDLERSVYGYLWRILGDQQAAEDLTQETFLRTWLHIDTIRGYERPASWVWRVATNLALNERRQRTRRPQSPLDEVADSLSMSDPAMRVAVQDHAHATLLALPARMRAALTLRDVGGLGYKEIARALDISPENARVTVSRAREQFRVRYQRTEGSV